MGLDGGLAEVDRVGDLAVASPLGDLGEDLALTGGERDVGGAHQMLGSAAVG